MSEARSYAELCRAAGLLGPLPPRTEVLLEERALDSFHNVLFSVTAFWERFGAWPARVTVVSHAFKRRRIMGHCAAVGVAEAAVVGVDPPGMLGAPDALRGEEEAARDWASDPFGRGAGLSAKRAARNPWGVWQGVFSEGWPAGTVEDVARQMGALGRQAGREAGREVGR